MEDGEQMEEGERQRWRPLLKIGRIARRQHRESSHAYRTNFERIVRALFIRARSAALDIRRRFFSTHRPSNALRRSAGVREKPAVLYSGGGTSANE